ncbi:hypothetical protein EVAR_56955_1 [Eumeta japonica]|uniref:Uncharacterized protein n=1 Tax=Eumeta variegata TaxID=151549 RepID=A0A4C1YRG2_EUMVA|nr:hypothetical protein EVAR_56955_1 [Eumeta japonica]
MWARYLHSMCGVARKVICRKTDVRERCSLKKDVVTRVERGSNDNNSFSQFASPHSLLEYSLPVSPLARCESRADREHREQSPDELFETFQFGLS